MTLPKGLRQSHDVFFYYRVNLALANSMVKSGNTGELPPISTGGTKREDFSISVPLWAYGIVLEGFAEDVSDPDRWYLS